MSGEAAAEPPYITSRAKSTREFASGEAASEKLDSSPILSRRRTRVHGFATKTKALAREIPPATQAIRSFSLTPWQMRTHCCRRKCFPVCPRAQHLLRTQKMFLILFRNILCPQQMFSSLCSPRNIMGNNVSSFTSAFTLFAANFL